MRAMEKLVTENARAIEKSREDDMMEDLLRIMKSMERGSKGSRGSVYGDNGKKEDIKEEWEEERKENQREWIKRVELPKFEGEDPLGWISRQKNSSKFKR